VANFIINFFTGDCCTGANCDSIDITGCACSGVCIQYKCGCAGDPPTLMDIPCALLLYNEYEDIETKYVNLTTDTGSCYYQACDGDTYTPDSTQIWYDPVGGSWSGYNYPPGIDLFEGPGACEGPTGSYEGIGSEAGNSFTVKLCVLCSGCGCVDWPSGDYHNTSGCLDFPE